MEINKLLGRNITALAVFLVLMGMGVVSPILKSLGGQLGGNAWQIEMLFTAFLFMMAFTMLPGGILAAKFGDKKIMCIGLVCIAIFATSCALSSSILQLSLFRAGWGFSNALFFSAALVILIALSKDYHKATSLFEGAVGFGIATGPLLGGVLGQYSWRYAFLATGLLAFLAFLATVVFVKMPKSQEKKKNISLKELRILFTNKKFILISISAMLYLYGFMVVLAYSPLVTKLKPFGAGLLFFAWGLALVFGSMYLGGKLKNKYEVKNIVPFTIFIFALVLFILMGVNSKFLMEMIIIFLGLLSGVNNFFLSSYVVGLDFEKNRL